MKKFLSIALLISLIVSVLVIGTVAATSPTYWSIDPDCLVTVKALPDGTVPTFKTASGDCNGLIVGLPTSATLGDKYFQSNDNRYTIKYFNVKDEPIEDSSAHIGTTDIIKVFDSNGNVVKKYGLVTYGDANGDGVFDVLDASVAALCLNGFISYEKNPAIYESVKPRAEIDNETVENLDYQQMVNGSVSDTLKDNTKGRKKPIDQTINFESVIYACDGKAKAASVTIADSTFKKYVTGINYNGVSTAPTTPGIYSVTATIDESEEYLVNSGERELSFIVIAPKNGAGYTTIVDNANKKITIDITKPNATGADLTGYINSWMNSEYNLAVSSRNVASATDLATAFNLSTYKYYTTSGGNVKITDKTIVKTDDTSTAALGCFLPDDYTLWNNPLVEKQVPVTVSDGDKTLAYTICFRQNATALKNLEETLLMGGSRVSGARGQRSEEPAAAKGGRSSKLFVECKRRINEETGKYENTTRIPINPAKYTLTRTSMVYLIPSTGFKTILIGDNDTIGFVSANKKSDFPVISSSSMNLLYDTTNSNQRYSALDGASLLLDSKKQETLMGLVKNVLAGMNLSFTVSKSTKAEELMGSKGWCRYICADDLTGLRYVTDYFLEFTEIDLAQDAHRTLLVKEVAGCTITTTPSQAITQIKDSETGEITDEYYHRERMTQYEPFRVSATLADGYKLSVKDANGNDVPYEAEHGWYIMPASDVTVTAVPIS